MHKHDVSANILLIDYGLVFENLNSIACIRNLPHRLLYRAKPMAFTVTLAGLRPLTVDIDYEMGMETLNPTISEKWNVYSQELVVDLWKSSKNKLARLINWRYDTKHQIHGELVFVEFENEVNLNEMLVDFGLADYFENLYKLDLEAKDTKKIAPRFTSICGPGSAPGSMTLDDSVDFSNLDETELGMLAINIIN